MSLTELIIPCLFYFLSWKYDDTTICTATNARNFHVTLNSSPSISPPLSLALSLSFSSPKSPSLTWHFYLLKFSQSATPSLCSFHCCCRFQSKQYLDQTGAARSPVCKHKESFSRRGIVCKHRSWGFDCWDSLKTTLGGSHPKCKYSEYSILKPLLPRLERGSHTALHIMGDRKERRQAVRESVSDAFWISQVPCFGC